MNQRAPRPSKNPFVFYASAGMVAVCVAGAAWAGAAGNRFFSDLLAGISHTFGWLYVLTVSGFVLFAAALASGRFGHIRLGRDDEEPEFSTASWFSMLFSAGMGIGLLFFSVAEPITHYANPPDGVPQSVEAARAAMLITFFHWGFHAWGIYAVVGAALAYFCFRHDLPLSLRSCLQPFVGDRLYGRLGDVVDLLAVFATIFGLATSLGLGAMQVNAGLSRVFGVENSSSVQVLIIAVITAAATLSVVSGLSAGVRRLSELNMALAALLLVFVFVSGPTLFLLDAFVDNLGYYLSSLISRSFLRDAYRQGDWYADWTLFYFAWWIAWSPFVGTFVARISRGRTLREFILGVLLVPSLLTFFWLTVFGDTALYQQIHGQQDLVSVVSAAPSTAIYALLAELPLATITAPLAALLVALFFVTSSDSGSLVVDMLTSGGNPDPPVWQRIFWAVTEGVVAGVLLLLGGLRALQSAAISAGLPLLLVLFLLCVGLWRSLSMSERARRTPAENPRAVVASSTVPAPAASASVASNGSER